jgi:hypothetical protein
LATCRRASQKLGEKNMSKMLAAVLLATSMLAGAIVAHSMGGGSGGGGGAGAGAGGGAGGGNWQTGATPTNNDGASTTPTGFTAPVTHARKKKPGQ